MPPQQADNGEHEKIYANDEEKSALHDVSLWDSLNFWLQEHAKTAKAMQEGAKAS
jgi:hypothetical protein